MKVSLETTGGMFIIVGYAPGEIRIQRPIPDENGEFLTVCHRSLIVAPEHLIGDWEPQSFEALTTHSFEPLQELAPEIVLIGTGARLCRPAPPLLAPLIHLGIGFEIMDTGAACRTYNLLAGEGRRVVAALLIS